MVSELKAVTYEVKLKELGLTTLEERRHQADKDPNRKGHGAKRYRYIVSVSEQCRKEYKEHSRSIKSACPASQTGSEKTFLFQQSC